MSTTCKFAFDCKVTIKDIGILRPTSSTCACVCCSRFCAAICCGVRGPPTIPSSFGSPAGAGGASPSALKLIVMMLVSLNVLCKFLEHHSLVLYTYFVFQLSIFFKFMRYLETQLLETYRSTANIIALRQYRNKIFRDETGHHMTFR